MSSAPRAFLCSAIGTPLTSEETLHHEGIVKHLEQQAAAGIDGILVGGTMGLMQLLKDDTYQDLVCQCVTHWKHHGEVLVGVGDTSFHRTRERLRFVNEFKVDGVVVLAPYFIQFSQQEMIEYYQALAAESRAPLYLYDLPQRTKVSLHAETVVELARHPNIAGIKCSGDVAEAVRLRELLSREGFRVIVAQPLLMDILLRGGVTQHLDGVFAILPRLVRSIADAEEQGNKTESEERLSLLRRFLLKICESGVFPGMTVVLNHQGIPGNFAPCPFAQLTGNTVENLLKDPAVIEALELESALSI